MDKRHAATKVIHQRDSQTERRSEFSQSPVFSSTYHFSGDPEENPGLQYGRFNNPSWQSLEYQLGELELGESVIFPSGMAAISALLMCFSEPGQTILLPSDGYQATRVFAQKYLKRFGVEISFVPTLELGNQDLTDVSLIIAETPSNPLLDIIDIKALAEKARAKDTLLAIDNSTLTPLGQQALSLNADLVLASDSKALNGHSDVVFGHVASKNSELISALRDWRKLSGAIPGPMETYLVQRGLASLDMRLERMCSNAMRMAEFLAKHETVKWLRYPGLATDPSHQLAKVQMNHFGFIITFDLGSRANADAFLLSCQLIAEATSFGGLHSMAERRARWQPGEIGEGVIRLSVGCEHVNDILDDLDKALSSIDADD